MYAIHFDGTEKFKEVPHCKMCMQELQDGEICEECYHQETARKCGNCCEKKPAHEYEVPASIICKSCFSRKPLDASERMIPEVSEILYPNRKTQMFSGINEQAFENAKMKLDQAEAEMLNLEEKKDTLLFMLGSVQDEIQQEIADNEPQNAVKVDESVRRFEEKLEKQIKKIIKKPKKEKDAADDSPITLDHLYKNRERLQGQIGALEGRIKEQERKITQAEHVISQLEKRVNERFNSESVDIWAVGNLLEIIDEGTFTREEMIAALYNYHGMICDNVGLAMMKLDFFIEKYKIISQKYRSEERLIRAGKSTKTLEDLIPSVNPVRTWFNEFMNYEEGARTSFKSLYTSYKKFCKEKRFKELSAKLFSPKFQEMTENLSVKFVKVHGHLHVKGVNFKPNRQ